MNQRITPTERRWRLFGAILMTLFLLGVAIAAITIGIDSAIEHEEKTVEAWTMETE